MERTPRRLARTLALALAVVAFAACTPGTGGAPEMGKVSAGTCYGASWDATAKAELGHTGYYDDFMERIFPRESGCDPCAYYPSHHDCGAEWPSTAKGLPGFLSGWDRQLKDACPLAWLEAWHFPSCQLRVVRWAVEGAQRAGTDPLAPWRLTR